LKILPRINRLTVRSNLTTALTAWDVPFWGVA
jgi:hypothetical protein